MYGSADMSKTMNVNPVLFLKVSDCWQCEIIREMTSQLRNCECGCVVVMNCEYLRQV